MNPRTATATVGPAAVRATPTTRRGTPWQEQTPSDLWPTAITAATAASSQGLPPAHPRHARTRVHQTGGAPTRPAPTRRAHPRPRPPPHHHIHETSPLRRTIIRSRQAASRAPTASLRERYAPLDPTTRPREPAAIGAGRRLAHAPNTSQDSRNTGHATTSRTHT